MLLLGFGAFQYPTGGAQALADALAKGVTKHGGHLALKTKVTKIVIRDGKASGIELADGTVVGSRYVVSNADGRQTFLKLVGEKHISQKLVKELTDTPLTECDATTAR
jgi:phytoene dehydrogenase-like protein